MILVVTEANMQLASLWCKNWAIGEVAVWVRGVGKTITSIVVFVKLMIKKMMATVQSCYSVFAILRIGVSLIVFCFLWSRELVDSGTTGLVAFEIGTNLQEVDIKFKLEKFWRKARSNIFRENLNFFPSGIRLETLRLQSHTCPWQKFI